MYRKSARTEKEYYARLSNGPMESFNRKPKDLKRDSRGFSDFNYTRNRILLTTRNNPRIKGVPKSMDQILSKKGNVSFKHISFSFTYYYDYPCQLIVGFLRRYSRNPNTTVKP